MSQPRQLQPQHQRTVDRLVDLLEPDPNYRALIIGGSIAKGWERPDSDVDIMLIATDEEFARRQAAHDYHYFTADLSDYEGGYVDGKVLDLAFLQDVAAKGSEPARSAFDGAWIAFSNIPELADLMARITVYPEADRIAKIQSFYAQLEAMKWFIEEAARHDNAYLNMRMASEMVLFGGRLILAYNRILYPYHKWLLRALAEAPEKPADMMALIDALLADPCPANSAAFVTCLQEFREWEKPPQGWPVQFMKDVEWQWRGGCVTLADW